MKVPSDVQATLVVLKSLDCLVLSKKDITVHLLGSVLRVYIRILQTASEHVCS